MAYKGNDYQRYYKDLRGHSPVESIGHALLSHFPFPNGVVPERAVMQFAELPERFQAVSEISNAWTNGSAIDSLVILLRLALALGVDPKESGEPLLYDLAFHSFGRSLVDDYIIKGKLLETLYSFNTGFQNDHCQGRVDVTLGELIRHPLVVSALWAHPYLQFFRRHTWAKKPGKAEFEPYKIDRKFVLQAAPFEFEGSNRPDLGRYFSRKLGIRDVKGARVAFASRMPNILTVVLKGGHRFEHMRSFALEGPAEYRKQADGTVAPVTKTRHYHLRAVLNLAESDIRVYHQDTTPVIEQLRPADEIARTFDYFNQKRRRAEHASGWTFEDRPLQYFLLIYARSRVPQNSPRHYQPPNTQFGEFIPPP